MTQVRPIRSVAIIGAGLAGISCASALRETVSHITVFEAEENPGGRMSSRRRNGYQYDCGAQYFTVGSDVFRQQIAEWEDQWLIEEWKAWIVDLQDGEALSHEDGTKRYIGRPVMHSFIDDMAELCDVRYSVQIKKIKFLKKENRWQLIDTRRNKHGAYDAVILAIPAPQASMLLKMSPPMMAMADKVTMTAIWSVMMVFDEPLKLGFDGALAISDELTWIAHDSDKSERDQYEGKEVWVMHASPEWSEANKKMPAKKVVPLLMDALRKVTNRKLPQPIFSTAELWPYAKPVNVLSSACLWDAELGIGACGDWCYAARVEGAYLSGLSMAARVLHDAQE